ncbi:MAG: hypothetical protein K8F36_01155 [Melioribacteraceae bacterium]|nr:hypothetical protein [Melioribacteraceae bacterium]
MKSRISYFLISIGVLQIFISAQSDVSINGYLQNLQTVYNPKSSSELMSMNSISNRFDLTWFAEESATFSMSIRNYFDSGELVRLNPFYAELVSFDNGYLDLTKTIFSDSSYILYSNIDRLNFELNLGDLDIVIGRQRVNWGINLVWTPNDIFNSFSYLNFDYVERPGSDAIRLQYYTSSTSAAEFVAKLNHEKKITAAVLYRFNEFGYDIQFLGGVMEDDMVIGGGFSGQIASAGFNGEATYFRDRKNFNEANGTLIASTGVNYTFQNSLYLHIAALFNSNGTTGNAGGINYLDATEFSVKNFTLAKYSLFAETAYQITPLTRASIGLLFNPSDNSYYVGPSCDISLTENIYLLLIGQFFGGNPSTEFGDFGKFFNMRVKWNF